MKILLSLALAFFSLGAFAQNTLEFNKTILLDTAITGYQCETCWTVPAGKTWKITGVSSNANNVVTLYLNNQPLSFFVGTAFSNTGGSYQYARYRAADFPMWLPAGTQLGFTGQTNMKLAFYGIEFNEGP